MPASRASYIIANGEIAEGMFICHRCDNPPCVNPAHLWQGTNRENMLDAIDKGLRTYEARKNCRAGHEITEANSYIRHKDGHTYRICKQCNIAAQRRYRERNGQPPQEQR